MRDFQQTFSLVHATDPVVYSEVFEYDQISVTSLNVTAKVENLTASETVDVTVEVSRTKDVWHELYDFDTFAADGTRDALISGVRLFARFKVTISGGTADLSIKASTSQYQGDNLPISKIEGGQIKLAASSPIQLSESNKTYKWVDIQALYGNTADIVIGGADAEVGDPNGAMLSAGMSRRFTNINLKKVYLAGASGNGVSWIGDKQ